MTVYVDDVRHRFRQMWMCHLWADSVNELHAFAAALDLNAEWFQRPPKASWAHYDISLSKKAQARAMGAVLTDRYGPAFHTANHEWNVGIYLLILKARALRGLPPDGIIG